MFLLPLPVLLLFCREFKKNPGLVVRMLVLVLVLVLYFHQKFINGNKTSTLQTWLSSIQSLVDRYRGRNSHPEAFTIEERKSGNLGEQWKRESKLVFSSRGGTPLAFRVLCRCTHSTVLEREVVFVCRSVVPDSS